MQASAAPAVTADVSCARDDARPATIHSIDAARGLAALGVVMFHWSHMYDLPGTPASIADDRTARPFFAALFPLYRGGWLAVDLFFTMSGFIFFWLYRDAIRERRIGAKEFFGLRLSRLYPLHLVTFLYVAIMQAVVRHGGDPFYVYRTNDLRHFVLNIFFAQTWGVEDGQSFNGPSWSASIELFLYAVFFLYFRFVRSTSVIPVALISLFGIAFMQMDTKMGFGLTGFFAGGCVWHAWRRLRESQHATRIAGIAAAVAAIGWLAAVIEIKWEPFTHLLFALSAKLPGRLGPWLHQQTPNTEYGVMRVVVLPATLLALVMHEAGGATFYRHISRIGDLTYSSYMIHFPMQITIAVFIMFTGVSAAWFQEGPGQIAFFVALIVVSMVVFRRFERPMQAMLRRRFIAPRK